MPPHASSVANFFHLRKRLFTVCIEQKNLIRHANKSKNLSINFVVCHTCWGFKDKHPSTVSPAEPHRSEPSCHCESKHPTEPTHVQSRCATELFFAMSCLFGTTLVPSKTTYIKWGSTEARVCTATESTTLQPDRVLANIGYFASPPYVHHLLRLQGGAWVW